MVLTKNWFLVSCAGVAIIGNVLAAIIIHIFGEQAGFIIGLKDAVLIITIIMVALFFGYQKLGKGELQILIAPLLFFMLYIPFGEADLFTRISSLRQILVFFLFVLLGYFLSPVKKEALSRTPNALITIGLIVVIIGYIERFTYAWSFFIKEYFLSKNIGVLDIGYPFVMIEPFELFNEFSGVGFLRMSSTFLDPINFGHACVFWYFLSHQQNKKFSMLVFLTGIFFAFSKAAFMQFILIYILAVLRIPMVVKWVIALVAGLAGLAIMASHPGFLLHQKGLITALANISTFGTGLGTAGNVAWMFGSADSGVSDSFLGALLAQTGVVGLLGWLFFSVLILKASYKNNNIFPIMMFTHIALGLLSENSINFLSIMLPAIMTGWYYSRRDERTPMMAYKYTPQAEERYS